MENGASTVPVVVLPLGAVGALGDRMDTGPEVTALIVTIWGGIVALAVRGAIALWKGQGPKTAAAAAPGAKSSDPLDHERRLLVLEAKGRALELEWEDTRAKFLGMTRSFIRQAKAAGLEANGAGANPDQQPGAAPAAAPLTSSRAAVLAAWKRGRFNAQS